MRRMPVTAVLVCASLCFLALPAAASAPSRVPARASAAKPHRLDQPPLRRADPPAAIHRKHLSLAAHRPSPAAVPAGEEIVTAISDTAGYHLFAASSGDRWRWHALATLQPGGYSDQAWIGEHCITGDGRFVVAVVAPWSANNSPAGIAAGGIAYAINSRTGAVRPLFSRLLLSYFNPGCGTGSSVALSRYTSVDQAMTQIITADAATGEGSSTPVIRGQVTSAVPVGKSLYAAEGRRVVRIAADGAARTLATHGGPVFNLTPNQVDGVDYLAQAGIAGKDPVTGAFRISAGSTRRLATGTLHTTRLLPGLRGHDVVLGAGPSGPPAGTGSPRSQVNVNALADVSTLATMTVAGSSRRGVLNLVGLHVHATGGGRLPAVAAAVTRLPLLSTPVRAAAGAGARTATRTSSAAATAPPDGGGDVGATCAIPRNDPRYQVPQPSHQQIDWALNLAGQYGLPVRGNSYANLNTGQYDPSADFQLPPGFDGTTGIPRQIMEGIFAQESNWKQASPHAPAGLSGNPLVADYYGIYSKQNTTGNINFSLADCGYGLGQITDLMRLSSPGQTPSPVQKRVALDYTENAAATAQTLARKWDQLSKEGITVGDNRSMEIEDWYFAIWAYNSGINPQSSTGNTTGCTPGPGCTDPAGNWGLGWTNNPANPNYSPLRPYFLRLSYDDASHPQDWPYQEKVFGWIESGQYESDGVTQKYQPTGFFLDQPGIYDFCDSSDNCNALNIIQPCGHNADGDPLQWHCWWHKSASFCLLACHTGDWDYFVDQGEPAVANPFPSVCRPPGNFTDTYIVDDSSSEANLAGCTGTPIPSAAMVWTPNTDAGGGPFGNVDLHQLGTGYGGRSMFTHLEDTPDAVWGGTMTWRPNNLNYDVYDVEVFVPTLGAAGRLTYTIQGGNALALDAPHQQSLPAQITVNQNDYGNEWVSLGRYYLSPGSSVSATNVVAGGDGATDVSFDAVAFRPISSYVSLGDSYSSGEGTGTYYPPTAQPGVNACHRSADSYAQVWARATNPAIPMVQLACSGAVIDNLTTTGQSGEPAQIPATPRHAAQVFLTIGGNDVGFATVLAHCLIPGQQCEQYFTTPNGPTFADNLDVKIDGLKPALSNAYTQLRTQAPNALVDVLTYPSLFPPTTSGSTCLFATGVGLPAQDTEYLISEADHLDNVIARAVNPLIDPASAVTFALTDERYAFAGHELCQPAPMVNGLTYPVPGSGDFHPTVSGYRQEADDITANPLGTLPHVQTLRDRLPGTPDAASALRMDRLLATGAYNGGGYDRTWFQATASKQWLDWPAYGGCTSAQLVLLRDNETTPFSYPIPTGACPQETYTSMPGGLLWHTPYDATSVAVTTTSTVTGLTPTVDHIVPLKDAYANGARNWGQGMAIDFANDWYAVELVTASAVTNNCPAKCDKSIEEWQPPNTAYLCPFAELWVAIKYQWHLQVDNTIYNPGGDTEASFLARTLARC